MDSSVLTASVSSSAWNVTELPAAAAGAAMLPRLSRKARRCLAFRVKRVGRTDSTRCHRLECSATAAPADATRKLTTKSAVARMKVPQLKDELDIRGLSTEGLKPDLVERLWESMQSGNGGFVMDFEQPGPANDSPPAEELAADNLPSSSDQEGSLSEDYGEDNATGFELVFLGTSSGVPTIARNTQAIALRLDKWLWLLDCGEATQHRMLRSRILKPGKIQRIFITHMHGDHIFGLPGVLCSILNSRVHSRVLAASPIYVYGPPGISQYVRMAMELSATNLSTPIYVFDLVESVTMVQPIAVDKQNRLFVGQIGPDGSGSTPPSSTSLNGRAQTNPDSRDFRLKPRAAAPQRNSYSQASAEGGPTWTIVKEDGMTVTAAPLRHRVRCFGYVFDEEDSPRQMLVDKAVSMGLPPGPLYKQLKAGKSVKTPAGNTIHPDQVLGPGRKGRKVVLLGDTRDSSAIAAAAHGADLIVHEATFENELYDKALIAGHSTAGMAGKFASRIAARQLVLTHFSARYEAYRTSGDGEDVEMRFADDSRAVELLIRQAQAAFPDGKVSAARDYLRIPVPRYDHGTAEQQPVTTNKFDI
eukprot:jgi/Chlat1/2645/Chrsp178S02487